MNECLCSHVRKLGRTMTRLYNQELRRAGMGISQLTLLSATKHSGPSTIGQLADALGVERTTLLRNSMLLCRRGWLNMSKKGARSSVSLTSRGMSALLRGLPHWNRAQARMKKLLGSTRLHSIRKTLEAALRTALVSENS
jgi:DNA-binding MarR family transcriptional regulator